MSVAQQPGKRNSRRTGQRFRPFAESAEFYRKLGWHGVIPVSRKGTKAPLVAGITGHAGIDADDKLFAEMLYDFPWANVGLRLPFTVIGIDIDAYDGHAGAATLASVSARIGPLPDTYRSTSRLPEDSVSGIYLFSAPRRHDWKWVSDLGSGSGIEIIQSHHRFATVAASRHNKTGRPYGWYWGPDAIPVTAPSPRKLAELPAAWGKYLLSSRADRLPGRSLAEGQAWFEEFHSGSYVLCDVMRQSLDRALDEIRIADARGGLHDAMIRIATHMCRNAAEGHTGLDAALSALATPICGAARRGRDLQAEWYGAFKSAFAKAAAEKQARKDPCRIGLSNARPVRIGTF